MAISQSRYILINSGVSGEAVAGRREFIARLFTTNKLAPTNGVLEFGGGSSTALKNVGAYFGSTSDEYKFASKYFGFTGKQQKSPEKISFARYSLQATAPQLVSVEALPAVNNFTSITDGSVKFVIGSNVADLTSLSFSSAVSLSDVADVIETALQGETGFESATFEFDNGHFVLTGGATGVGSIEYAQEGSAGTDISGLIKLRISNNPVLSVGMEAETLVEALSRVSNISNNFYSYDFIETLSTSDVGAIAQWNNAQNVAFCFSHAVSDTNYADIQDACKGCDGVALTLDKFNANAQFMPMSISASIDFGRPGASTCYMFNQFNTEVASVETDADADKYDALKINYLGATQQAGKNISFYQRGFLQGDIADMGVHIGEAWLKDAISTEFLNLLVALPKIPANEDGTSMCRGSIVNIIESEAKSNGVISVGKDLTNVQKQTITLLSGDVDAWRDVATNGYWLDVVVEDYINDKSGLTEYKIKYLLIYSKGDAIRKVEGTDILI